MITNLSDFDYSLPNELIAQTPTDPRDSSKLMVINKKGDQVADRFFNEISDYFSEGDILVLNNTKVFPARLIGNKVTSNGQVEILLNHKLTDGVFEAMGRNVRVQDEVVFPDSKLTAKILAKENEIVKVKFNLIGDAFNKEIEKIGLTPLPPYIKREKNTEYRIKENEKNDRKSYQTVYAKERGSVAAPTAGLHFTPELIRKLKDKGVDILYLTLHVGLGTFSPIKCENILEHKIHREYYSIDGDVLQKIMVAKGTGRRIIAVGTTTTRVLEHLFSQKLEVGSQSKANLFASNYSLPVVSGWTDIYIYPSYKFKCIDGLITNFHLPKSSLLVLVSAYVGRENILNIYKEAIRKNYRFFSYGDAMLIL